ncbi:hypothetical protein M0804_013204 [Polistes exclamans]|nr:hypothetical protein M0804_013204 [Polistes exclamans]
MSKQTRQYKFLEDINNIGEEFSEISEDEFSENEDILDANKNRKRFIQLGTFNQMKRGLISLLLLIK